MVSNAPEKAPLQALYFPLKRFGRPQEVAAIAVLLASDEAAYMSGSELTIDGGILAGATASPGS